MNRAALLEPIILSALEISNRVWLSPMCMYACEERDGQVTDLHRVHYGQYALGSVGLILTEATAVLPEGRVTPFDAGMWCDSHIESWRKVVDTVHGLGGLIAVQLSHAGRKAGHYPGLPGDVHMAITVPPGDGGWQALGGSGLPFGNYPTPRRACDDDLCFVVEAFGKAAQRAVAAGFDAVEIHAAHGYLLHELLSPATNDRTDRWGGNAVGRERLLRETAREVRAAVGPNMPVLVRLSVEDGAPGGLTAADTVRTAMRLVEDGVDLIDCSTGGLMAATTYRPGSGYQVRAGAVVHSAGVRTGAVGMITSAAQAETVVRTGQADVVLLGRELLRDPYWAQHAAIELGGPVTTPHRYYRAYQGQQLRFSISAW